MEEELRKQAILRYVTGGEESKTVHEEKVSSLAFRVPRNGWHSYTDCHCEPATVGAAISVLVFFFH